MLHHIVAVFGGHYIISHTSSVALGMVSWPEGLVIAERVATKLICASL